MYNFQTAAQAADIEVPTLRMQFSRGVFVAGPDDKASARRGDPHMFTINTVRSIAIANALHRLGVPLPLAAAAGDTFAYTRDGQPQRKKPGNLYAMDNPGKGVATIIVVPVVAPVTGEPFSILPVWQGSDAMEFLVGLGEDGGHVMVVDHIWDRVNRAVARA
jgi:hypothetical protein